MKTTLGTQQRLIMEYNNQLWMEQIKRHIQTAFDVHLNDIGGRRDIDDNIGVIYDDDDGKIIAKFNFKGYQSAKISWNCVFEFAPNNNIDESTSSYLCTPRREGLGSFERQQPSAFGTPITETITGDIQTTIKNIIAAAKYKMDEITSNIS